MIKKFKLFWKIGDRDKNIECVPYSDDQDYYLFLKNRHSSGYRQVIISSEVMIQLIREYVFRGFTITEIQLAEEDDDFDSEMDALLAQANSNPAFFVRLFEHLNFLSEQTSIEIQRIHLRGRLPDKTAFDIFIQSNGIIGIDSDACIQIASEISILIGRWLFG